jgi:DNA-binding transcriptional LysR family regulator
MQMNFNLDRLRTFIVVARTGNLSAAARELDATQPNVGRQMAALEKEIGLTLFVRHSRGLGLTKQGEEFLALCHDIFGRLVQGRDIIREKDSKPQGILRVVTGIGTTETIIENIHTFSKKNPSIQFHFSSTTDVFCFHIGDADVGIIPTSFSDPDLIQHHLFDMILRIYASPSYFQEQPMPDSLEDLENHRLIAYVGENDKPDQSVNIHLLNSPSKEDLDKNFVEVNNIIAMRAALIGGLGIGPYFYSREIDKNATLIDVFQDMPDQRIPYYYTYHKRLESSPKVHAFHEFLKELVKVWERPGTQ